MKNVIELAKQAKIIGQYETDLAPNLKEYTKDIVVRCGQFVDPVTRKFMFQYFGIEE